MEEKVFPSSAVAELMKKHLVEARLHTDSQNTLSDAQFATNKKAQAEIAGTIANPYFVVVDAKTGAKVAEFKLSGGWTQWEGKWQKFVGDVVAKTGRAP